MTRRRKNIRPTNWFVPIVVSLIVASVAWTVTDTNQGATGEKEIASSPPLLATTEAVSSTKVYLSFLQPKSDRDRRVEMDLETGAMKEVPETSGWRVGEVAGRKTQVATSLKIDTNGERGSRLTDGGEWNVTLRAGNGDAYQEPILLGLFNDTNAAVTGRAGKSSILNVSRSGAISLLANLPENAEVLGFSGGSVWYATFTPGEGIESDPSGPSTLFRVTADGKTARVADDPVRVFVGVRSDGVTDLYWTEMAGRRPELWLKGGAVRVELPALPAVVSWPSYDMD